tara:strand:- start:1786 stop:3180 length:1395 start_codon:yes stop_codon:yes gene_type:complete
MGSFNYSDDYSSFDNLLDRTTLLTEGGKGLGGYHPGFGPLRSKIEDAGGVGTYRARQFVVSLLYRYIKPSIINEEELDYIESQGGAASKGYNAALTEVLDKHKDEIAQRADEIGDAMEENFPEMANKILGVNPEKAQGKMDARKAQQLAKDVAKDIQQGEDIDDSVEDALDSMYGLTIVQAAINKILTNIQTNLGEPGLDIREDALQQVIDYVDKIETVDQLEQFVNQITPLPDYQKIALYLSSIVKPLRKGREEGEEEGTYEADKPGGPAGAYGENETGQNITQIEDEEVISREGLNNNMRKKRLLVEKRKNWGKFRSNRKQKLVVEKDLDAAERRALPDSDFALPGEGEGPEGKQAGSYPIPDKEHARMALAMVAKHGTPEEKKRVRAAVARKFPGIKQEDEEFSMSPMLDSYQTDTSGYLSEQVAKDKRNNIMPETKNQSFKERFKPKTHWQLQELRRRGL